MRWKFIVSVLIFLYINAGCGCSRAVTWFDERDRSEPLMKKARSKENEGNLDSAIRLYTDALDDNPKTARAHLNIALLLHDYRKDYMRAIYHYRRYLELRSHTEKKAMIEDRIRLAEQLFAASVYRFSGNKTDKVAELHRENVELKAELWRLRDRLVISDATVRVPSAGFAPRSYRVRDGDTLSSIANKVYGDPSRWEAIYKANRQALPDSNNVQAGQVLVIP